MNGAGLGVDRPAELSKGDDEYDAFRKRMMLAYRFRPNPLVIRFSHFNEVELCKECLFNSTNFFVLLLIHFELLHILSCYKHKL